MGILKHLSVFLGLLSPPLRLSYLPCLHGILHTTNPFNWRLRQALAAQLPDLLQLPPPSDVYGMLFPLTMTLLQDPVASVRSVSYKGVAKLINLLLSNANSSNESGSESPLRGSQDLDAAIRSINTFIRGETYLLRQLWVELTEVLLAHIPRYLFEYYFMEGILLLALDPVTNVRIAVARLLVGWERAGLPAPWDSTDDLCPWKWLLQREDIRECVDRLSVDDYDIFYSLKTLQPLFPDVKFARVSCRGRKVPPGGANPVRMSESTSLYTLPEGIATDVDIVDSDSDSDSSSACSDKPPRDPVSTSSGSIQDFDDTVVNSSGRAFEPLEFEDNDDGVIISSKSPVEYPPNYDESVIIPRVLFPSDSASNHEDAIIN